MEEFAQKKINTLGLMSTRRFVSTRGKDHYLPLTQISYLDNVQRFLKITGIIVSEFHIEPPEAEGKKISLNMAAMPIYG